MSSHSFKLYLIFALFLVGISPASLAADEIDSPVVFDLPPIAAARPAAEHPSQVTVQLRLSSMIESTNVPRIDQWIVRCQPRDAAVTIADYAPRTETASDVVSPIQVKESEESSQSLGLSLDAAYGHLANGSAGSDRTTRNQQSVQYDRAAPVQAVTASGTINRGRGVYFKLRWTAQQILEGEKVFELTLDVPAAWRGSLIDVSVIAQSQRKSLTPWDRESKVIAADDFVVAVYRDGDDEAATRARAISDAEHSLRKIVATQRSERPGSLASMLRSVTMKFDRDDEAEWLERLIRQQADPHHDPEICKLPMPVRVAVLDYADVREEFSMINDDPADRVLVAKPAL